MTKPNQLFHYRPFNNERLRNTILHGELYFSNPGSFNDPWDCRPWWNTKVLDDPVAFNRHLDWFNSEYRKNFPDTPEHLLLQRSEHIKSNPDILKNMMSEFSVDMASAIDGRYRVFCLSSKSDNELMWAHYSEKHQGICLEFGVDNVLFCNAEKVSYLEEYPVYDLTLDEDSEHIKPLISKSSAWEYEDEYRLVAFQDENFVNNDLLVATDNFVELPDNALTAIIIGCMAPSSTLDAVKNIVEQSRYPIKIKQAVRAPDHYKLSIVCT